MKLAKVSGSSSLQHDWFQVSTSQKLGRSDIRCTALFGNYHCHSTDRHEWQQYGVNLMRQLFRIIGKINMV